MKSNTDNKLTARAALANAVSNAIVMVTALVMISITTRILSARDLGIATNFFSARSICLTVLTLATYMSVNRGMLEFRHEKKEYLSSLLLFNTLLIGGLFLIYLPFQEVIARFFGYPQILGYLLFVSVFFWLSYNLGTFYLMFHNRYIKMLIITMCVGVFSQLTAIWLILHFDKHKYMGRLLGIDGFYWIIGLIFIFTILFGTKKLFKKEHIRFALRLSIPLIPHLLAQTLLSQSDILMITKFTGAKEAGIYSMAYTIGQILYTALIQIMNAWSPWVYRRMDEDNLSPIYRNSKILYLVAFVLALLLMMITPEAVTIFLAGEYWDSMYLIPILVVGMYFLFLYTFFYDVEYYHKKTKYIAIASVIASVINILLNAVCIPVFGYVAAGYTTAVGYFILMLLHMYFMKKIETRKIYNLKLMFFVSIAVVTYAVLMYLLIDHLALRYGLALGTVFLVMFHQRKAFLETVKVLLNR